MEKLIGTPCALRQLRSPRLGCDDAAAVAVHRQRSLDARSKPRSRNPQRAGLFLDSVRAAQPDMPERQRAGILYFAARHRFGEAGLELPFLEVADLAAGGIGLR